jgi:putative transposase
VTDKTDREAAVPPGRLGPVRKRPVHLANVEGFNEPVILFVTVCTKNRKPILATDRVHRALRTTWSGSIQYHVGCYVIMPDHVHLFCSPAVDLPESVQKWVAYWKRLTSVELKDLYPIWQRDCWDTQLRHFHSYDEKWAYVVRNPVRKGLVSEPEEWPYQGCLNDLHW